MAEAGATIGSPGLGAKLAELHPRRFFLETWATIDAQAEAARRARREAGLGYDYRPLIALVGGAVLLTLMEYWGDSRALDVLAALVDAPGERSVRGLAATIAFSPWAELWHRGYWAISRVVGYFVLPAVLVRLSGERVRDQGLATKGFLEHAWIYALCYLVVLVCVIAVSFDPAFQSYYPFYDLSRRSLLDLAVWEVLYAAQFFALEFFFRGYWLRACQQVMGSSAIFAMVVPYVMIHFGKPMAETLAAAIAGVVLGTLAMKTRSIWSGVLIHVSVAVTMDVAALLQTDRFPTSFFPTP